MRAVAAFPADKRVRLVDHPEPVLRGEREVMLRMLDVGVCGTDREIARFDYGTPPEGSPYLVMGHESLAEVGAIGSAVDLLKPGDLVITTVRRPCGRASCPACAAGRQDFCVTGAFAERGIQRLHGFMTERVVDDARYMHPVPAALREVAVLVEPLTIAQKALIEAGQLVDRLPYPVPAARRAVVLGAGPVGLLGAMALRLREYETFVYSRDVQDSDKARWVRSIGATYVSAADCPAQALGERLGEIDLIYEATGAAAASFAALQALGTNGVFVFTGVPGRKGPIELDADALMRNLVLKNQLVYGTVNAGPDAFAGAISDLAAMDARWPGPLRALITARVPPEGFAELLFGDAKGIKQVLSFA